VLLPRVAEPLLAQHGKRAADAAAGAARGDDVVEEAAAAAQSMTDEAEALAKSVEVFKLKGRGPPQLTVVRAAVRQA